MRTIISCLRYFIDIIIFAFPKVVRNQYSESYLSYFEMLKRLRSNIQILFKKKYTQYNDISELDCKKTRLFHQHNRSSRTSSPCLITNKSVILEELNEKVPDINVYLLEHVAIVGGTDLLINQKTSGFYHFELSEMGQQHDMKAHDIISDEIPVDNSNNTTISDILNASKKRYIYHLSKKNLKDDTIYLCLLKEHSVNYYHWITEVIPRLLVSLKALSKQENFNLNNYTLVVDDKLPMQLMELLLLLTSPEMKIIVIKRAALTRVKKLVYCSPLWLSLDNTKGLPNPRKEFFIDRYALNLVRSSIKAKNPLDVSTKPFRRIYLRRLNNKLRPLKNLDKLEDMLRKQEFDFIDVGNLTFLEQIKVFAEAKIIVGISGAAFTNILFMNKGTHAISLYPSSPSTNYYVFQPLADASGVCLLHFLTQQASADSSVHAKASVDVKRLERQINELGTNNGKD